MYRSNPIVLRLQPIPPFIFLNYNSYVFATDCPLICQILKNDKSNSQSFIYGIRHQVGKIKGLEKKFCSSSNNLLPKLFDKKKSLYPTMLDQIVILTTPPRLI